MNIFYYLLMGFVSRTIVMLLTLSITEQFKNNIKIVFICKKVQQTLIKFYQ